MPLAPESNFDFLSLFRTDNLFGDLSSEAAAALKRIKHPTRFEEGVFIFAKDEMPERVCLLLEGRAQMSADDQMLHRYEPNEIFCLPELIAGEPCPMNINATTKCLCECIDREDFIRFLTAEPEVLFRLARLLGFSIQKIYSFLGNARI